jgi:alcohol dehydrogenase class IV
MRTPAEETFRFRMPVEVHSGPGVSRRDIGTRLASLPANRISLVVDPGVEGSTGAEAVRDALAGVGELHSLAGPVAEPDFTYLEEVREAALSHAPTLIVGLGGGSTMDAAKGLAIVLNNDGPCASFQGLDKYERPGVPCVTVPTLFGSGAEVTPSAVFINRDAERKGGINGAGVFPKLALVDPELVVGAPRHIIASTALDAMVHAVESYEARCATPVTRRFSQVAFLHLSAALDRLAEDHGDVEALDTLGQGAFFGILALLHSEQGLAGGASYPMGVHFGVPHGVAGGRTLPHAILFNAARRRELWADFQDGIGGTGASAVARRIHALSEAMDVPRLSEWIQPGSIPFLAERTHAFQGVMQQNPVELQVEDITEFFEGLFKQESQPNFIE